MRQKVVSLIPDNASLFETATPVGIWGEHRSRSVGLQTEFVPCGLSGHTVELEAGLSLSGLGLLEDHVDDADIVVIPTWPIATHAVPEKLTALLNHAHAHGARIVGLCLGAFAVASTGLLDDKTAVTHWRAREHFETMFPAVDFSADTLYVDHDTVVTSAGSAAAVDCCVHLVRRDHGSEVAATLARSLVTAPHRSGAQSQFAAAPQLTLPDDPLSNALALAAEQIGTIASVGDLAALAGLSRRSIERHLHDRLSMTPAAWLSEQRVITACRLLETTELSVDQVARDAGYGSTPSLRRAMRLHRSTTPTMYRSDFRGSVAGD